MGARTLNAAGNISLSLTGEVEEGVAPSESARLEVALPRFS
jgi:hypothetical protein